MKTTTRKKQREELHFDSPEAASAYKTARMNEMLKKIKNIEVLTNSSFTKS